jgi:F-type H+-transporting ATPase subunit delta
MIETHVASRYARALFNVALSRGTVDIIGSELFQLKSFSDKDRRLVSFLEAPQVLTEHKTAMVRTLFTTRLSPALLSFILLLIEKGRVNLLDEIARDYEKLLEEHKGIIRARVTTAVDVDKDYKARLAEKLKTITGKEVDLIHRIDKSIIGGIIVQLNYKVIDHSVRNQLSSLKHDLMRLKVH